MTLNLKMSLNCPSWEQPNKTKLKPPKQWPIFACKWVFSPSTYLGWLLVMMEGWVDSYGTVSHISKMSLKQFFNTMRPESSPAISSKSARLQRAFIAPLVQPAVAQSVKTPRELLCGKNISEHPMVTMLFVRINLFSCKVELVRKGCAHLQSQRSVRLHLERVVS